MRAVLIFLAVFTVLGSQGSAQCIAEGKVQLDKARIPTVIAQRYLKNLDAPVIAADPPRGVVYLEGHFPAAASQPHARMAQKGLAFETPLLPVRAGTLVSFPNQDDTYHNIFSFSSPKRFDLGRYRKDETPVPTVLFDKPGAVALHCDIHEHMRSVILVLETPFFTTSDLEGKYRLEGLPPGKYILKAWVDSKTIYERAVELKPGAVIHTDFP